MLSLGVKKESFRVMKSELDVHPIHFQKENSAKGYVNSIEILDWLK